MLGYKLSQEQYDQVQGKQYAPYQCFNCVESIDNIWFTFLTELDKQTILNTEYNWILDLPQGEYIPKPSLNPFNEKP
jgi:hypothetical protein